MDKNDPTLAPRRGRREGSPERADFQRAREQIAQLSARLTILRTSAAEAVAEAVAAQATEAAARQRLALTEGDLVAAAERVRGLEAQLQQALAEQDGLIKDSEAALKGAAERERGLEADLNAAREAEARIVAMEADLAAAADAGRRDGDRILQLQAAFDDAQAIAQSASLALEEARSVLDRETHQRREEEEAFNAAREQWRQDYARVLAERTQERERFELEAVRLCDRQTKELVDAAERLAAEAERADAARRESESLALGLKAARDIESAELAAARSETRSLSRQLGALGVELTAARGQVTHLGVDLTNRLTRSRAGAQARARKPRGETRAFAG